MVGISKYEKLKDDRGVSREIEYYIKKYNALSRMRQLAILDKLIKSSHAILKEDFNLLKNNNMVSKRQIKIINEDLLVIDENRNISKFNKALLISKLITRCYRLNKEPSKYGRLGALCTKKKLAAKENLTELIPYIIWGMQWGVIASKK